MLALQTIDCRFGSFGNTGLCNNTDKESELVIWAMKDLGAQSEFTRMLTSEYVWIMELISKRNAFEHPGKTSGTLHIVNFQKAHDGRFYCPTWYRDNNIPTDIMA